MTGFSLSHSDKITILSFLAKFKIFSFFPRSYTDATWTQDDDLRHLDPLLLDCYISFHSSE